VAVDADDGDQPGFLNGLNEGGGIPSAKPAKKAVKKRRR